MLKTLLQTKKHLYSLVPILQRQRYPAELGLLRMADLLERLGNPHHNFVSVHVAGTAGKGSVSYLIGKIMGEAGLKVGSHIKPHLQTMRERLIVDGKLISEKGLIALINKIRPIVEEMDKKGKYGKPSYFEVLIAAALLRFEQQKVDLAVVEAGLGGRYDGSNVLRPKISVVTNVGLDHTGVLGKTKQTILKDKMQIIKSNSLALTGIKQNYLLQIIKKHCQDKKVPLSVYGRDFMAENVVCKTKYSKFDFVFKKKAIKNIKLSLPGVYQIDNACLAIAACLKFCQNTEFKLKDKVIKKALLKAFFPGRMELVSQNPSVILDGAHNEDKMKALVRSMKEIYPKRKIVVVFGVKKDKDARKMLSMLKKISKHFVLTQFGQITDLGAHLHQPVEKLMRMAKKVIPYPVVCFKNKSSEAIEVALKIANKKDIVLIIGSFFNHGFKHFFSALSLF